MRTSLGSLAGLWMGGYKGYLWRRNNEDSGKWSRQSRTTNWNRNCAGSNEVVEGLWRDPGTGDS